MLLTQETMDKLETLEKYVECLKREELLEGRDVSREIEKVKIDLFLLKIEMGIASVDDLYNHDVHKAIDEVINGSTQLHI